MPDHWVLIVILSFGKTVLGSRSGTGFVSIMHLGYTNDPIGNRLAIFAVTNHSHSAFALASQYWMQAPSRRGRGETNFSIGTFAIGTQKIQPGQSERLQVSAPTIYSRWRIYLFVKKMELALTSA